MGPPQATDEIVATISTELERFPQLVFAVLFGSAATGRLRVDSDLDVAVYGASAGALEVEREREIESEAEIQIALERATGRNVELLVLNRAPATVCAEALGRGHVVLMRDRALYTRYFLAVTTVAIDFLQTEREYRTIRDRGRSLSAVDRSRLLRIVDSIESELEDRARFRDGTLERYRSDRDFRRNLDRWVETLINAAIDIGKIVLAAAPGPVPYTYGQILGELEALEAFSSLSGRLQPLAPLRNLLAHEYLDLRFGRVTRFVEVGATAAGELAQLTRAWARERHEPQQPEAPQPAP